MAFITCFEKDFKTNKCFEIELEYIDNFGNNYELINGTTIYIFSQLPIFKENPKEKVYFFNKTNI